MCFCLVLKAQKAQHQYEHLDGGSFKAEVLQQRMNEGGDT